MVNVIDNPTVASASLMPARARLLEVAYKRAAHSVIAAGNRTENDIISMFISNPSTRGNTKITVCTIGQ